MAESADGSTDPHEPTVRCDNVLCDWEDNIGREERFIGRCPECGSDVTIHAPRGEDDV